MNKNQSLVSVIVTAFNHSKYVIKALKSVVEQTYPAIQIIFIDDGSIDNSFVLAENYLHKANRPFVCRKQENKGLTKTLNYAIENFAEGEFISMLAADDWWDKNNISRKVEFMNNNPDVSLVYSSVYRYYEKFDFIVENYDYKRYKRGVIYNDLLFYNFIPALSVLVRSNIYDKIGLYDENLFIEDWDMWLRIAKEFKIDFLKEPLCYYRIHGNNIHMDVEKCYKDELRILNKHKDSFFYRSAFKKLQERYCTSLIKHASFSRIFKVFLSDRFFLFFKIKNMMIFLYRIVNVLFKKKSLIFFKYFIKYN